MERLAILGGGAWGTALALQAARCGCRVQLWVREPELVAEIEQGRENTTFLPGYPLPAEIEVSADLNQTVAGVDGLLSVVPSAHARSVYTQLDLPASLPVVCANKGIEEQSLMLPIDVAADVLGAARPYAVLSGPSFASDVAAGRPTALVIASESTALADTMQRRLSSATLRVYTNRDPVGVQVGAAMKNVIAIAAGMLDGLGVGANARAALITRGLAEMTRLGCALGAQAETFAGLTGMGDLVLTATDQQSRNFTLGRELGRGVPLQQHLDAAPTVAEGWKTTRAVHALARRHAVTMPIVDEVYRILYQQGSPRDSVQRLMERPLISETPDLKSS